MKIVFVHLGTPIPSHLSLNVERTAKLFPEHAVWLLTDQLFSPKSDFKYSIFRPTVDESWASIETRLNHPKDFRGNFWFTTIARFLAMDDFSKHYAGEFLHVESDVVLAKDFPFEAFSRGPLDIYFPVVSTDLGIASTIYFRDAHTAKALAQYSVKSVFESSSTTDMHILRGFLEENPTLCGVLPSAPPILRVYSSEMPSPLFQEISNQYSYFLGIFDGIDYGKFLFGHDPRNRRGWKYIRKNDIENYINVRASRYVFNESREFPDLLVDTENDIFPFYSLHIHAKNLKVFNIKSSSRTIRKYVAKSHLDESDVFSLSIFLKALYSAAKRRLHKLWRYLT